MLDLARRTHYLKHIYNKSAKAAEIKRRNKRKAVEYKGGKCVKCGEVYPPCVYDFHHIDPKTKVTWSVQFLGWGWERMKTELDKCILLCANCHRLEHQELRNGGRL